MVHFHLHLGIQMPHPHWQRNVNQALAFVAAKFMTQASLIQTAHSAHASPSLPTACHHLSVISSFSPHSLSTPTPTETSISYHFNIMKQTLHAGESPGAQGVVQSRGEHLISYACQRSKGSMYSESAPPGGEER
ncbi:hypothetical protein BD779DRAFT_816416 [Infundibulicybe gibba]|nr:hypothetical protein BD779DRAFT_816416 [Infundibulicybe gibba]